MGKIEFDASARAAGEINLGDKGYEFHAENEYDPANAKPLIYRQSLVDQTTMPWDLSAGVGLRYRFGEDGTSYSTTKADKTTVTHPNYRWSLGLVGGGYANVTQYRSNTDLTGVGDNYQLYYERNALTGTEAGGFLRLSGTYDILAGNPSLPAGVFVEGRMGSLLLSNPTGQFYVGAYNPHAAGEPYKAPMVGEVGFGLQFSALSAGLFFDTGTNSGAANLGPFTQTDLEGNSYGDSRNTSIRSGVDNIGSSVDQLQTGNASIKVQIDLFEAGREIYDAVR